MTTAHVPDDQVIERSMASLYALVEARNHHLDERTALKDLFAQERTRLTASAGASFAMARCVVKALGLHRLFHEVKTVVESDLGELISCLFHQAETFLHRYRWDEPDPALEVVAAITSLQKELHVKSHTLHQLPCHPTTATKRVDLVKQYLTPTSRFLCLGDDDFLSIGLALSAPNEITVVDLDPQLITLIEQVAQEQRLRITCRVADIRKPLPEHFYSSFDVVITDPIYSVQEMLLFLSVAESCLRRSASSYLVSCCSRSLAGRDWRRVEDWAAWRGLMIHTFLPGFNEYPKTARLQKMLMIGERLLFRSAVTRACMGIPFLYSDLVVFRYHRNERGNEL
ncbi:MAG: bis-aminopropyl spermidine synthase family protein [Acidobacteria bacterium]|nr:bis-aminopropyl spermidine synthase family protein [Acidobacteriota bacterium]